MPFLNPAMLFGIGAISIPIVIHLLNRRKFERVVWAAMRFLKVSVEQNQRRIQIEDLLLLLVRCVLLCLLALALARPMLHGAAASLAGPSKVTAVVVVDNSLSMSQSDGVQSRLDLAKKAAAQVIAKMPAGSSAAVLLSSDVVKGLIPEPTFDLTLATRSIQEAPLYDRPGDLLPAVKAAIETLKGRNAPRKEIYILTDGQARGFSGLDAIKAALDEVRSDVKAHFILVGQSQEKNLAITALRVDGGLTPVDQPVRLEVRVKNFGRAEAKDVGVSLHVDDDPPMDQAVIAAVPPGEVRSVSLFARMKSEGYHAIHAKLDGDLVPADDVRTLALRAVKDVKVLLIDGEPGRSAAESEVFFLRHALQPVSRAELENYFVHTTTKTATELDGVRFEDFDAVISANVTDFSPAALNALSQYVKTGGALWLFPGDNINVSFYNEQLYKTLGLLPAMIGPARGDAKAQDKFFSLQAKSYEHPIVSIWQDAKAGSLSSARFFKAVELIEPAAKDRPTKNAMNAAIGAARVIVRYQDNTAAAMERDWGQGRVVLWSSTADGEWNDIGARAGIWVPLVQRTLGHLVARQDEHLTVKVGQEFSHVAPVELTGKDVTISKAARPWGGGPKDQKEEVHESRRVELVGGTPTVQFGGSDFAGAYDVKYGQNVVARFAAQADASPPEESTLDAINETQIKSLSESAHVLVWTAATSFEESLEEQKAGAEMWLPVAMLALALATLETMMAHWFSRSK